VRPPHSGPMKTVLLFMVLVLAGALPVASAPKHDATVVLRTYDYANVSSDLLAAARKEAEQIFTGARIAVRWIDCAVPGKKEGAPCTEPLAPGRDLMLRLFDRTPANATDAAHVVALGESMVDREERGGVLMTVDLFPVRTIGERTSTGIAVLLGRAIAHEIGHLLLGSADHPRLGLMRARWSSDELRGLKPTNWGFSSREAAQMRQTLRGRSRTAD
jgi:hypothetical protein